MQSEANQTQNEQQHLWMGLLGALAGLSMWVLFEVLTDTVQSERLLLWIASATVGFFVLVFAFLGSLKWREAVAAAAVLALADAALFYWASARFIDPDVLMEDSFAPVAWGLVLFLGAPFVAAAMQGRVRDYTVLFDTSWNIVVRYIAAWIFVGIFWGLVFLSDALLEIVGITVIDDLLDLDPVPYVLTGAALGLALSVAQDLKAYVSPYLPLRLLRLLLPMVLVVVAVFIVALPVQGLSQLFGDFSAAAILMSVAIASITLITSALDRVDADGIQSRSMVMTTRALALLLPILAGLAVWAIWLRVSEYGWTPERIAASLAALLVMAYALLYGLAVFQKDAWRTMIRQANMALAVTVLVLSVLWLTPLMDAQRISAKAQLDRYLTGISTSQDVPAWELTHVWGVAGQRVLAEIRALHGEEHQDLQQRLDRAADQSRWQFNQNDDKPTIEAMSKDLTQIVQVWPEGRGLAEDYFSNAARYHMDDWMKRCALNDATPCAIVFGPFGNQGAEIGLFFVPKQEGGMHAYHPVGNEAVPHYFTEARLAGETGKLDEEAYRKLISGGFRVGPASRKSLWLGEVEVTAEN